MSAAVNATIAVGTGVGTIIDNDQPPVIDLDADNSTTTGSNYTTTYTENGTGVSIADTDIVITDVDSTTLVSATITLTNAQLGDVLSAGTMPVGITANIVGNVVTLTGIASLTAYQTAIRAITFSSTSENPSTTPRVIHVVVNDGLSNSNTAIATINVVAVNDAPIAVSDNYSAIEGTVTLLSSVLLNDSDVEGDPLTVSVFATNTSGLNSLNANGVNTVTTALGGTVVMNANGTFTYTAPVRNHGDAIPDIDSFAYRANDGSANSAWTTVTINIGNTVPTALNDVDSVGFGGTTSGNVITGAGGASADILSADGPHTLSNVVLTQGTLVSNTVSANNVRTIQTTRGTLVIDQNDGSYTYTLSTPANITVNNPTGVASFTSVGINLFGFDGGNPYNTAGNASSGLNLSALNAASTAIVRFQDNAGENDDGIGVETNPGNSNTNRIENGEQLVISLGVQTRTVALNLKDLAAGETANWETYNASGVLVNSGTVAGGSGGVVNFTITSGVAFSHVVLRSVLGGSHFRMDGISVTPEPTALSDIFTYTLRDGDGDTSTATLTVNYNPTTTAVNDFVQVFEAGINRTATQSGGTAEASNAEFATGNILANDIGISSTTQIVNVNGVTPNVNGVITITDARGIVTFYTQNFNGFVKGDYVIQLTGSTTQGVNDVVTFNYQLQNTLTGQVNNATLTVNIVDDVPIANNSITTVSVGSLPVFNVFFMIDVSGSMTIAGASGDQRLVDANGNATIVTSTATAGNPTTMTGGARWDSPALGTSSLAQTRDAVKAVITKYFQESTNVSIQLGVFSTGARFDGVSYTTLQSALAAVDALTNITGGTNYSAGLIALQQMIGTQVNPNDGVSRISYFITDGIPGAATGTINNAGPGIVSDTVNPAASTGFANFVNANNIQSYAIAVGPAVPNTAALVGIHNVDSDASGVAAGAVGNGADAPIVITNVSVLGEALLATVPNSFNGSIAGTGGGANLLFGADGGYVQFIEVMLDSADPDNVPDTLVRFTFNGTNLITNNNSAIAGAPVTGSVLTLSSVNGFTKGSLIFNFNTGDYTYAPQGAVMQGEEIRIVFGIIDGDGDTASAVNIIRIVNGKPIAIDDFDTMLPSAGSPASKFFEGNVLNAAGTDGGGAQITGFRTGVSGEDVIVDGANVTSIVFRGVAFNLTTPSAGVLAGGNYTINAAGELTWTNTANSANVLVFHRDGYYRYTPPAADVASPPQGPTQTVSFANNVNAATTAGLTLQGFTRTANLNNTPDATVTFNANGAGVGSDVAVNNLENFGIVFNRANYPNGVQNVTININAAASLLGNNGSGGIGALQYSVYDISGNLLGQFASIQEGAVVIPAQFSNIGRILIQPNSSTTAGTGSVAGSALISGVVFNAVNVSTTPAVPDEVIRYTITDIDGESSSANLTLRVVTNHFAGGAAADTINGTNSNDLISGLDGDDILNGLAGNDIIRGGRGNDIINGGAGDDRLYGDEGDDTINGGTGNDLIFGGDGNDTLFGDEGNDAIYGGAGNDIINGGSGNDLIVGGAGNDILTGGLGVDTFKWELGDQGAVGTPAFDVIADFDASPITGDILDLRDLLIGEQHEEGVGNLTDYLHFQLVGGNTVIHVSNNGGFFNGFTPSQSVQVITLQGTDLVTGFNTNDAIIQNLLINNKLLVD